MTDSIIERGEDWLRRHDYESRAFTGAYAVVSNLVTALKAARAENIRLSAENSRLRFMDRGL